MKRSYSLRVERLEDRCVPATLTTTTVLDTSSMTTTDTVTASTSDTTDTTNFVIDPYVIDPNATPIPTKMTYGSWTPDQPIQPISDPLYP
jgi:hypothetical protein